MPRLRGKAASAIEVFPVVRWHRFCYVQILALLTETAAGIATEEAEMAEVTGRMKKHVCKIMLMAVAVLWIIPYGSVAFGDMYAASAHGNDDPFPGYGVNRVDKEIGDCAHCHEVSDASVCGVNDFMLFADVFVNKQDMFCTKCHSANVEYQPTTNYPYSVTFGGYPTPYYGHILKQTTDDDSTPEYCGSRHNMTRIKNYVKNDTNGWGFGPEPNPCVACHPPHRAQRNHSPVVIDGDGKLNTAIRRPSHYRSTNAQDLLWGDDEGNLERMDEYAASVGGTYQAPYYGDTTSGRYEPDGSTTEPAGGWGSNIPNYVALCLDCHQYRQYDPDNGNRSIDPIRYDSERHGELRANDCTSGQYPEANQRPPYIDPDANYVLSCLDCHEPHGTKKRLSLIRRMINGENVLQMTKDGWGNCIFCDWEKICGRCHELNHAAAGNCTACHHHGGSDGWAGPCRDQPIF
ncbi:MAG: hypothetical protein SWQ30_17360 [Thermodesulfobacteriota bacterium]|nr:hypothetical protein [Thermodesulfobacteriota bacterium]